MNDRDRWNRKYSQGSHTSRSPSPSLVALQHLLPATGNALDVAGGAGRHAIWLANRGLDVTLVDVSDVALGVAAARAEEAACDLHAVRADLQHEPFPRGPWDLIVSVHFLWRPLFQSFAQTLACGGKLVVIQPTISNLQRNPKPPAPFLLADGELPSLVAGLHVEHYEEGWSSDDQHQAVIVARRDESD